MAHAESATMGSSTWVRGPLWDGFWMLNALWLLPVVLWLARGYSNPQSSPLDGFYLVLSAMFWIGHRLGSSWIAYCTDAYRPLLRLQPVRFIVVPLLVTLGCFFIVMPDDASWPWTREERVVLLAVIDYVLVTYHFAAQHFGALSLYRSRAERSGCARTRLMDRLFALGVGGALIFLADVMAGSVAYHERWFDHWVIPAWLASNQQGIRTTALQVLWTVTALTLMAELRTERRSVPRVLYVLGLAAMVTVALSNSSPFLYIVIWTSQHWILATGLASQASGGQPAPRAGAARRALQALNSRPWAVLVGLAVLSALLLPFFEVEANLNGGSYYGDRIFGALAEGLRTSTWVPALIALGFATGFVHYLLDRNVYRMSDPRIRSAASGLLAPARQQATST